MVKVVHSSTVISREMNLSRSPKRLLNWGEVAEALKNDDNATIIAFLQQGYSPEKAAKAPLWITLLINFNQLNEKYTLWKMGILG